MVVNNFDKIVHSSLGAQILSAKFVKDKNIFYKSPINEFGKTYRGGVPVLFPQFANVGNLRKHGFVRDIVWELMYEFQDEKQSIIEYDCNINNDDYAEWPHNAKLNLFCEMSKNLITIKLIVINNDNKPFEFTGGLHPYFAISSRDVLTINGLESAPFKDAYPTIPFNLNSNKTIERLYETNNSINFFNGENWLSLKCKGFDNWMIWNPGEEGTKSINDLPNDEWSKFICIEPIIIKPKILEPGELYIGELQITLIKNM
jgi:glucose-6-phosphate 1-epimerase